MERILECIDRGLDSLGQSVRQVIYWRMGQSGLSKDDLIIKPDLFVSILEQMFGVGAERVERNIVREIKASFGPEVTSDSLLIAIKQARTVVFEERPSQEE